MEHKVENTLHNLAWIALLNFLMIALPTAMYYDYQVKLYNSGWGHSIMCFFDMDLDISKNGVRVNVRPYQDYFYRLRPHSDYHIMKYEQLQKEAIAKGYAKFDGESGKFEWR